MKWRGISEKPASVAASSLAERLTEIKAGIAQYVRPENQAINERAITDLTDSGISQRILPVGAKAPEFTLTDQNEKSIASAELLSKGPLVINFFRGRWCPFCVTEIEAWRDALSDVKASGASLVAISPQLVRHNSFMADQHKLPFPLLSDDGNNLARRFNLVYRVPEYQQSLFRAVFINLPNLNGNESWELPLPATYLVDRDGTVLYANASANYMERADPSDVLKVLSDTHR